jgi:hypothetical protein
MRPVRIIATAILVAALAVTGCTSRSTDQTAAPSSSAPSSASTTQPTAATTRSTAGTAGTTTTTLAAPTKATCALSPTSGPAGTRVTLSCRGFAPSEEVDVTFGATVLATAKATTNGQVAAASFAVPGGFAGSTIPGRKDTFQAKGRQSGKTASATFTVASPAKASCALSPTRGLAGSRVTLSCRGFAPSEPVAVTFGAEVLAITKASAGGQVAASFAVPSGFAGSHYPGRKDTFQAKGRQSGTVASATFTVTG